MNWVFDTFVDSFLTFGKILKKLEDFTLPSGDAMLEKWIASLGKTNTLLKAGDLKAAVNVGLDAMPVLRGILPAIPDKIIYAAIESLPKRFEADLDGLILSGTTTLADVDKFIKFASETMLSAMSKTTPTAETLN